MQAGVWILLSEGTLARAKEVRAELSRVCKAAEVAPPMEGKCSEIRNIYGRLLPLLAPRTFGGLYQAIHRQRVMVFDLVGARVRLNPSDDAPSSEQTRDLPNVIRYKAHYLYCNKTISLEMIAKRAEDFLTGAPPAPPVTYLDPRCLPVHCFTVGNQEFLWSNLESDDGRKDFGHKFGTNSNRKDAEGIHWSLDPHAFHGGVQEQLHCFGHPLELGLHWDVSRVDTGTRLMTATEIWNLKRGHYVNVYPDMVVRPGQDPKRKSGTRFWP